MTWWLLSEAHGFAGHLFSFQVSVESSPLMKHTVASFIAKQLWMMCCTVCTIRVLGWLGVWCLNKSPQELVVFRDQYYHSQHVYLHNPKTILLEIFVLLVFQCGNCIEIFQTNLYISSSRVKKSTEGLDRSSNARCLTFQKSRNIIYIAAESWIYDPVGCHNNSL